MFTDKYCLRYLPVTLSDVFATSSGVPVATTLLTLGGIISQGI